MKRLTLLIALISLTFNGYSATTSTTAFASNNDGPGFNYKKHGKKSAKIKRKNRRNGSCPYAYGG